MSNKDKSITNTNTTKSDTNSQKPSNTDFTKSQKPSSSSSSKPAGTPPKDSKK
jgi:hypothetical protein